MPGKEYRFNPETLTYEGCANRSRLRIYRLLRKGLVVIITVCIVNLLFSFVFHTPKMDRIARENEELLLRYALLDDRIREDAERLDAMHQRDISVYRPLFGADSLDITGIYVPYPDSVYAYLDAYPYGDRIKASWQRLDRVTRALTCSRALSTNCSFLPRTKNTWPPPSRPYGPSTNETCATASVPTEAGCTPSIKDTSNTTASTLPAK